MRNLITGGAILVSLISLYTIIHMIEAHVGQDNGQHVRVNGLHAASTTNNINIDDDNDKWASLISIKLLGDLNNVKTETWASSIRQSLMPANSEDGFLGANSQRKFDDGKILDNINSGNRVPRELSNNNIENIVKSLDDVTEFTSASPIPSFSTTFDYFITPIPVLKAADPVAQHTDMIDDVSSIINLGGVEFEENTLGGGIDDVETNTTVSTTQTACREDDESCYINHNQTCVGDPSFCNLTYDEYMKILYDYIYPTTPEWILIFSHCVVFIMGLVGNALVCIAVYTNYSMRTVTNIFIVNLAVADFFVILFCLPPTVVWDVTETWFMGKAMCKVVLYFQTVSVTVSVLTLTFISIDRWYAICFPLRYRTKISRAVASVVVIWIIALVADLPELMVLTTQQYIKPNLRFETALFTQCMPTWSEESEKNFQIAKFILLYTSPLLLMTVAYFKIVRVLWKSETIPGHRESRNHQYTCGYLRGSCVPSANSSTMGQLRARRKAAKMLVAVVVMFAGCYFPVHALSILRYAINLPQSDIIAVLSLLSHWLCYANSAVNPVIYNFMSGKFRREFHNALEKCRCARVRVEDRSLNHSTPASRINNISPSSRSNYQLTSVRETIRHDRHYRPHLLTIVETDILQYRIHRQQT